MSDDELRREALRGLIAKRAAGNVAAFCNLYDLNPVYIAALVRAGSKKSFGEKSARALEKKIGLAPYALNSGGGDSMAEIEQAIKRAEWLSETDRKYFIGLLKSMRDKRQ